MQLPKLPIFYTLNVLLISMKVHAGYDMSDLDALVREKNPKEFFEHYMDIRPSERKEAWKTLVSQMANFWLTEITTKNEFTHENFLLVKARSETFPLNENEAFFFKKNQFMLTYFKSCFQDKKNQNQCGEDFTLLLNSYKSLKINIDSEWAYQILKSDIRAHLKSPTKKELLRGIFTSSDALIFCEKPEVFRSFMDYRIEENSTESKTQLEQILSKSCLKKMAQSFKKEMYTGPSHKRSDYFEFFKKNALLTSDDIELYYIVHLIDNPEIGDILNLAWSFMETLGENYKKRQEILNQIKTLKLILGDSLFQNAKLDRNQTILKLTSLQFPEYFDYYAETCFKILNGEEIELVKPPKACHEFFKISQASSKYQDQYLALKKKVEGNRK